MYTVRKYPTQENSNMGYQQPALPSRDPARGKRVFTYPRSSSARTPYTQQSSTETTYGAILLPEDGLANITENSFIPVAERPAVQPRLPAAFIYGISDPFGYPIVNYAALEDARDPVRMATMPLSWRVFTVFAIYFIVLFVILMKLLVDLGMEIGDDSFTVWDLLALLAVGVGFVMGINTVIWMRTGIEEAVVDEQEVV